MLEFPPRGSGKPDRLEFTPHQTWISPDELGDSWTWSPGKVLLGEWNNRLLGRYDDRHMVTVAGTRSGKSYTVLGPNLRRYPGSCIVLDPKAELVKSTASARRALGSRVIVLDPFGETGGPSANYNPFHELGDRREQDMAADALLMADALIIANEKDPHWTESAKNLIRGISLYMLAVDRPGAHLGRLRQALHLDVDGLKELLKAMAAADSDLFSGIIRNVGTAYLGKLEATPTEFQSILSTAQEQTAPLDDIVPISKHSDFRFGDLRREMVTVYLVLPGMRMGTHARWLRLLVQQAMAAMERYPGDREHLPVWFVLEEFAALGYMRSIETAAGFMAGLGVMMWSVLQDFTQLRTHYPKSWETFLGNAGLIQAFGNSDVTTTEHLSKMMGSTQVIEAQDVFVNASQRAHGDTGRRENVRNVPLLEASEISYHFARDTNRQLVLMPGRPPIYMNRFNPKQHGE
jgi:type IV secretion system protein VirD4